MWITSPQSATASIASDNIQMAINEKLKQCVYLITIVNPFLTYCSALRFPRLARESSTQWTKCLLPISVAHVLKQNPTLISPAVNAFYNRDPLQLKEATKMKKFGVNPVVPTMVRFTRCLFAQLQSQQFHPPLSFGNISRDHIDHSAYLMGAKLVRWIDCWWQRTLLIISTWQAVGFEILYADQNRKRRQQRANDCAKVRWID